MTLVVWSDLSSRVVTDEELRVLRQTHPKVRTIDLDERWSGKYLACEPERPRGREPLNPLPNRRASDMLRTRAQERAWGRVAREREERENANGAG